MERFLDDQETPPPPPPASRDRSASPVHSLLFGDPKRNHLKPHSEHGMGDNSTNFQPINTEFDVNTATPTVQCVEPKVHNPAEGDTSNICLQNGLPEEGYVPPSKRVKADTSSDTVSDIPSDLHSSTASTETQNHIDSLSISSVDKISTITSDKVSSEKFNSSSPSNSQSVISVSKVELGHSRSAEAVSQ